MWLPAVLHGGRRAAAAARRGEHWADLKAQGRPAAIQTIPVSNHAAALGYPQLCAGEMKSTKIARFLNQFYSGKACASAVKIGGQAWLCLVCAVGVALRSALGAGRASLLISWVKPRRLPRLPTASAT